MRMLVGGREVQADCILELAGAPVHPSLELLAGQFSEPALNLVDPGRVGRREVQVESGMPEQPALRRRRLVGAEVVEDEVDLEISRHLSIDAVEELPELDRTVAPMDLADDHAGRNFECGEGRGRAMTPVVEGPLFRAARLHCQHWLAAVERLELSLLVDTLHERVVGRIHVQPDDVPTFSISCGSLESLKVSVRCGCKPTARRIRCTVGRVSPLADASSGPSSASRPAVLPRASSQSRARPVHR